MSNFCTKHTGSASDLDTENRLAEIMNLEEDGLEFCAETCIGNENCTAF